MPAIRRHPPLLLLALASVTLLLAGCSTATAAMPAGPSSSAERPAAGASAAAQTPTPTDTPLPAAQMICSAETQGNVAKILSITHPSKPDAHWADDLYTCTYRVPTGTLRLSVKQSANPAAARAFFTAQQSAAQDGQTIEGLPNLGLPAYQTPDGRVSFVKDNMTLLVDGSQLGTGAPGSLSHTHLAYQVATAILGCWSE